ncbi:MAG TPA: hypothetical protein VM370_04545 [Candidatus Thermoplasmatota archaeon]|nr:hypothetical protein [Candidatus Thermoplasmatota archaeon]
MSADAFLRKVHRVLAIVFLLSLPPATWASIWGGGKPAFFVYAPIPLILLLAVSGTYMLVRPWILKARSRS